jgi:undecaprenyl diphosphate synthase
MHDTDLNKLNHLAIVMDGNSRWALANGHSKIDGYYSGAKNVKIITEAALGLSIKHLTLYAFSHENWQRPKDDVDSLLHILNDYLDNEIDDLHQKDICLKFIGKLDKLSDHLLAKIASAEKITANNSKMNLYIAFSYSGRQEIVDGVNKIIASATKHVGVEDFSKYLYCSEMPDVDFLIRTGKEQRLSNFLLWQLAYTELFFSDKYWPEFTPQDLESAIKEFTTRSRNFGHAR